MDDGPIQYRVFRSEMNRAGDLIRLDQSAESRTGGDALKNFVRVADVIAQHFSVGETRAETDGMDTGTSEILAGCPHHADTRMLGHDLAE